MKALLLAAGLGTRLYPITAQIPKCLVPINGKPLLQYWLEMLELAQIPCLINTHYYSDQVDKFLKNSRFNNDVLAVYEKELLGTAGTLLKNRNYFSNEAIMLIHADNLSRFDIGEFILRHQNRPPGCEMTMMTFTTTTPHTCGILKLDNQGVVREIYEKVANPPGNLANGAVYILEPSIFEFLSGLKKEFIDFSTEILPYFTGKIFTYHNSTYHLDIGSLATYTQANEDFHKASGNPSLI